MLAMRRLHAQTGTDDLLPVRTLRTRLLLPQTGTVHLSCLHSMRLRNVLPETLAVPVLPADFAELAVVDLFGSRPLVEPTLNLPRV